MTHSLADIRVAKLFRFYGIHCFTAYFISLLGVFSQPTSLTNRVLLTGEAGGVTCEIPSRVFEAWLVHYSYPVGSQRCDESGCLGNPAPTDINVRFRPDSPPAVVNRIEMVIDNVTLAHAGTYMCLEKDVDQFALASVVVVDGLLCNDTVTVHSGDVVRLNCRLPYNGPNYPKVRVEKSGVGNIESEFRVQLWEFSEASWSDIAGPPGTEQYTCFSYFDNPWPSGGVSSAAHSSNVPFLPGRAGQCITTVNIIPSTSTSSTTTGVGITATIAAPAADVIITTTNIITTVADTTTSSTTTTTTTVSTMTTTLAAPPVTMDKDRPVTGVPPVRQTESKVDVTLALPESTSALNPRACVPKANAKLGSSKRLRIATALTGVFGTVFGLFAVWYFCFYSSTLSVTSASAPPQMFSQRQLNSYIYPSFSHMRQLNPYIYPSYSPQRQLNPNLYPPFSFQRQFTPFPVYNKIVERGPGYFRPLLRIRPHSFAKIPNNTGPYRY